VKQALALVHDARARRHMSEAGRKLCQKHRGATERHLALIAVATAGAAATAPARG
jgi:hypothetical protein